MVYTMKRSGILKAIISLLIAIVFVCSASVTTYANDNQRKADLAASEKIKWNADGTALAETNGGFKTGSNSVTVTHPIKGTTTTITVSDEDYLKLVRAGEKLIVQEKVDQAMGGINVQADTDSAQELLGGVQPIIELFCGIIVYAIVLGLPVFTSLDLLYITYPVFRNGVQNSASQGGMMAKTRKDGSTGVRWVSDEAQYAVENANLGEGKRAITIYGKERFMIIILCAVMLFVFLTGNIQIFTNLAVQIVSGVISVIQGIS